MDLVVTTLGDLAQLQSATVPAKLKSLGASAPGELSALDDGFSLHAGLAVGKDKRKQRGNCGGTV